MSVDASRGDGFRSGSGPDRLDERAGTQDGDGAGQIVGENVEGHLGTDVLESLHQEVGCSHSGLYRAEGMFDGLTASSHGLGIVIEAALHGVDQEFMLPARDSPLAACGAAVLDGADQTGGRPVAPECQSLLTVCIPIG